MTTTASRVKTLLLHAERHHGRAAADALSSELGLEWEFFEDETRAIGLGVWYAALVRFASRFGRDELLATSRAVVATQNLAAWARVLRGADSPAIAFRQLGDHGGDETSTDDWETLEVGPNHWRGLVLGDAGRPEERDGLPGLARAAELASVPLLYGRPPATVRRAPPPPERADAITTFEVEWHTPGRRTRALGALAGVLAGVGAAIAVRQGDAASRGLVAAGAAVAIAGGAQLFGGELQRRADGRAQLVRLHALERGAALRDQRSRGALVLREGAVVAGEYRLLSALGTGGSGTIWEATRLVDGQTVAMKLLKAAVAHDTVATDRLRREAAALGLAWHPNVVEVYADGFLSDGTSYLVMERLYGESLAARLRRDGPLAPDALASMLMQVCDALAAVHAAGVVHRDVKPSNVFLAQVGPDKKERVKLLDFGVARVEWAETRITNYGSPLGTPGYMPPEQEEGREVDARSDLFALGAVAFECLVGEAPPPMRASEAWDRESLDGPPSGVMRAARQLPRGWRELIGTAMAFSPHARFQDARRFRDAVSDLVRQASA